MCFSTDVDGSHVPWPDPSDMPVNSRFPASGGDLWKMLGLTLSVKSIYLNVIPSQGWMCQLLKAKLRRQIATTSVPGKSFYSRCHPQYVSIHCPKTVCLCSVRIRTFWEPWLNWSTLTRGLVSRTAACSGRWLSVRTWTCSSPWRSLSCEQSWPGEGQTASSSSS